MVIYPAALDLPHALVEWVTMLIVTRDSGLGGLAKRVGSVDGSFRVSSPAGGPTTLTAELPCEL